MLKYNFETDTPEYFMLTENQYHIPGALISVTRKDEAENS